jgi:hypothetical protein
MKRQLIIALLASACGAAGAQTIYRCGNTYSEQPCPAGTTVEAARPADPAEVAASRKETERQMKVAGEMEKARLKEEDKPVAAYIPKEKAEPATKPHKVEVFTARAPVDKKKPAKKKKTA